MNKQSARRIVKAIENIDMVCEYLGDTKLARQLNYITLELSDILHNNNWDYDKFLYVTYVKE